MILHQKISTASDALQLVSKNVRLSLFSPGRASFDVVASEPVSGAVVFEQGYEADALERYFVGFVESSNRIDDQHQRLFCREVSALVADPMPLSLRSVTLPDVLDWMSKVSQVTFVTDESASYANQQTAFFYSLGCGYYCLDSLADVFGIDQLIWQQRFDGSVFVGSWADSAWAGSSLPVPDKFFQNHGVSNSAKMPVMPKIRPGAMIEGRGIVTEVQSMGGDMVLSWSSDPWKNS